MHANAGDVAGITHLAARPVHGGAEECLAAVRESIGPALAEEAGMIGAEYPCEDLAADLARQHAVIVGWCPWRVREVRDPRTSRAARQHSWREAQVVVLDHCHGCASLSRLGQRDGKCL